MREKTYVFREAWPYHFDPLFDWISALPICSSAKLLLARLHNSNRTLERVKRGEMGPFSFPWELQEIARKEFAETFNPYSDVPKELESDGWAFVGLVEVTNLNYRELVDGFLEGKTVQGTFSEISRDTTLSHAYLDKLKNIYTSPAYQDWSESHPLGEKRLKKEIVDAWVEEWRRMNRSKPSERSIIADITSLLPQLSEDGLRKAQAEIGIALSVRDHK